MASTSEAQPRRETQSRTQKSLCSAPPRPRRALPAEVEDDPLRRSAILKGGSKWLNGTVLHFCFFQQNSRFAIPEPQADAVRKAFATWTGQGIGLSFKEVTNLSEAEVRIGYSLADGGSYSRVGTDVLTIPSNMPTTVYGWDLTTPYGRSTALHELGHVLGLEHEHQSPFAGIKWHDDVVYQTLSGPPNNWSRQEIYRNVLEKLDPTQVLGSAWDPDSIMEYEFEAGLIDEPEKYDAEGLKPPGTISKSDKDWVLKWYPGTKPEPRRLKAFETSSVDLKAGEQVDFTIIPDASRSYTIMTKGASDTVLGLFEEVAGEPRYLTADDDSGTDRNASITYKLFKDRTYIARLRLYYPGNTGMTAVTLY